MVADSEVYKKTLYGCFVCHASGQVNVKYRILARNIQGLELASDSPLSLPKMAAYYLCMLTCRLQVQPLMTWRYLEN